MVEVAEDNETKEKKGKRDRKRKGDEKRRKSLEPTTSYSAAHVTTPTC